MGGIKISSSPNPCYLSGTNHKVNFLVNYPIASISKSAKNWLMADQPSRVLHVFEKSCNLINKDGEIFSLVDPIIRNGPFSAVLFSKVFPVGIESSDKVKIDDSTVRVGKITFDASKSIDWNATVRWSLLHDKKSNLLKSVSLIEKMIEETAPLQSFAEIVLNIPKNYSSDDPIFRKAKGAILELNNGLLDEGYLAMRNGARSLAGLGIGLTPAGDDYLVGAMLALFAWEENAKAHKIASILSNEAIPLTNSISAAWLKTSMLGEAGESWHALVRAMAYDQEDLIVESVMRILPSGHTSGADALGAFVATIRILSKTGINQ